MKSKKAFTLVESVIAIGIFVAIAIAAYNSFRSGILAYERIESQLGQSHELNMLIRQLGEELRNSIYYAEIPFQGESDRMTFPARLKRFDKTTFVEDLYQVSYLFRSSDLERSEERLRKKFNDDKSSKEVLLTFDSLRFQYAFRRQDGGIEWRNEWSRNPYGGIPRAIRMVVKEKKSKDEKSFQFLIPHGILGLSR